MEKGQQRAELLNSRQKAWTGSDLDLIDGSTFQQQIEGLAIAMINLVEREGHKISPHKYATADFAMVLRQLTYTYNLLFFLNADEHREGPSGYRQGYSFVILPLIRTMIDGFYNITAVLDDFTRARRFRASGYKMTLESLEEDRNRYGTDLRWIQYTEDRLKNVRSDMSRLGFFEGEVRQTKLWPTLTGYLREKPSDSPHRQIVRALTLGFWKEYSAISHATFQGLMDIAPYISRDRAPHELRSAIEDRGDCLITTHLGRAAAVLLCLVTELQAFYRFQGANLGERLHNAWNALAVLPEVKELYESRYAKLMQDRGIKPHTEIT